MIEERKMSASDDRKDLLTNLIRADQEEEQTEENRDGIHSQLAHQDVIGESHETDRIGRECLMCSSKYIRLPLRGCKQGTGSKSCTNASTPARYDGTLTRLCIDTSGNVSR